MLLFTTPSPVGGSWREQRSFDDEAGQLRVDVRLDIGQHAVSVRSTSGDERVQEIVGPAGAGDGEPVSSFHLPPYYRWEHGAFSCRFVAEWREGAPSIAVSLRHLRSLRTHPRALIVDDATRGVALDGAPAAAMVMGTPRAAQHPDTGEPATRLDWRGWHIIDTGESFDGPRRRVLATHTEVFRRPLRA